VKLLYVCSDFGIRPDGTKGASVHLRAITRALCEQGHEVTLLSPHPGPGKGHPATRLLPGRCPPRQSARALQRWLDEHGLPTAAAAELRPLLYNPWAADRAIKALRSSPPDAVLERLCLFGCVGLDIATALRRPFIVEVNALLTQEARRFRGLELIGLAEPIESQVLSRADAVTVVSRELADLLRRSGVDEAKIRVIPNGADIERFDPNAAGGSPRRRLGLDGQFVVGFAGSLKVWHGVDLLVAAFRRLREADASARLLIVGAGPMEQQLRQTAAAEGLADSVLFTGAVDHALVPGYLSVMDVAVAPFRAVEDFYFSPIKLFEYMAAGRCVVASRLGQIGEIITDGENGLLCRPDDVDSLAAALIRTRRDADLRRRLGLAARTTVENNYTWQRAARSLSELIGELCAKASAGGAAGRGEAALATGAGLR